MSIKYQRRFQRGYYMYTPSTAKYVTFRAVHYPARGRSNACGGLVGGRGAWGTETIRGMLEMALVK